MNDITVIITSSYIPSHPKLNIINSVINSIYNYIKYSQELKIIIACDGLKENNKDYLEYIQNLINFYKNNKNIEVILNKNFGHLVGNIKNVINKIETKYIMIIQHDLLFCMDIDLDEILEDLNKYPEIKHLRFNKRNNIKAGWDNTKKFASRIIKNKYILTESWSDQNHISTLDYYKNIVLKEVNEKTFMERILNKKSKGNHKKYGTFIYGHLNMKNSIIHVDGSETRRGKLGEKLSKIRNSLF